MQNLTGWDLNAKGMIYLYEHDYPRALRPDVRNKLVVDNTDRHFNVLVLKEDT